MCLRSIKLCRVGKHVNIIMKPTNSPTQGQRNPRKNRLKGGNWATFFPTANNFCAGWDWLYIGNRLRETQHNQISPQTHVFRSIIYQVSISLFSRYRQNFRRQHCSFTSTRVRQWCGFGGHWHHSRQQRCMQPAPGSTW